ncbi:hypothetical protein KLP40_05005 [Hymenobacter sp. NST-14]|uniref:hypothetical protein n=1 Tax=Hymenobacter piscis TaxID=2839984 RepID=UPI001C0138D1|nr:hypothetical protein [Hymenobacter piscis]MBT9392515.1 hypothetical protein [Hymenobacter piscis]
MKQPKKRWAWTPRQRGRIRAHNSFWNNFYQPSRSFIHEMWVHDRALTRVALTQIRQGADEAEVHFPYHHKHQGHWQWA